MYKSAYKSMYESMKRKGLKPKDHVFMPPIDTGVCVSRYMDLAKLIFLLDTNKLYLRRLGAHKDSHEGSNAIQNIKLYKDAGKKTGNDKLHEIIANNIKRICSTAFISSWCVSNDESDAMWRLFCNGSIGVAVRTTYDKLAQIVDGRASYIGLVKYINYKNEIIQPVANILAPAMHKRKVFQHENEVRVLLHNTEYWGKPETEIPLGLTIDFDSKQIIDKVLISPYAESWYFEVVKSVVERFSPFFKNKIEWSAMSESPVY